MKKERINVGQARKGTPGYVIISISVYPDDIKRIDEMVKKRGGNRSSVTREAWVRMAALLGVP